MRDNHWLCYAISAQIFALVPIIAVMFTFSFGSAFAATPAADKDTYTVANVSDVYGVVATKQAEAVAAVEKEETDALYAIFQGKTSKEFGDGKLVVTYDQVKAYYDEEVVSKKVSAIASEASAIYAEIQKALNDKTNDYIGVVTNAGDAGKWTGAKTNGYNIYVGFATTATSTDFTKVFNSTAVDAGSKSKDIAKDAFAAMVSAKLAQIAAIDEAAYIAKDQDAAKELKAKATKQVTQLANRVANGTFDFSVVMSTAAAIELDQSYAEAGTGFAGRLAGIYTPAVNEAAASGKLADALAKLTLSADEPTQAAKLAWARAQVMDKFETAIEDEYDAAVKTAKETLLNESLKGSKADQTKIDAANDVIENAKELKDAAMEIATYLVNECDDLKLFIIEDADNFAKSTVRFATGTFTVGSKTYYNWNYANKTIAAPTIVGGYYTNLVDVVGYVQDLKDEAAALKADIAIDGTTAVDVDALLEDAIDDVYKTGKKQPLPSYTVETALHKKMHALTGENCFEVAKTTEVKIGDKKYTTVTAWDETAYEYARLDEVKAIKKETKKAIMDAATVADAEAAFLAGLDKYDAVLDKNDAAMNRAAKAYKDLQKKYEDQLGAEIDYTIAGIVAAKSTNNVANAQSYLAALKADLAKAYTVEELTEKYEELSAEVKALKTKDALDAEKKELEERCKAYSNVNVTAADKDELVALRKDVADYKIYVQRITGVPTVLADYGLNNKVRAIADLEKKAIEDAYKAINKDGKATLEEAAAVAELDAAVDAYNDGWDEFIDDLEDNPGFTVAPLSVDNLSKFKVDIFHAQIDNVEAMIAKLPADGSDVAAVKAAREAYDALTLCQRVSVAKKYYDKLVDTEKLVARSVETLKIKASSKATKGAITVKWTVKGNKAAADGFQVWKSTKAQKGYKKAITTKKTSFKNTKNLKKGVRYFYKVRAYAVVDGVKVYSDWSNKANRIAK